MAFSTALLLLLWQAQVAIPTADDPQLARIEGRVVHALTGEAVRNVQLTLRKRSQDPATSMGAGALTAASDDGGKFHFDKLEPGTYSLYAERTGFLRQEYGARTSAFMGTPLTVRAGEQMSDVSFKLLPQSVIAGRVVNEEGEPVQHAQVMALRQSGYGGAGAMNMSVATNDIGEFRVADLAPGRYLLRVLPQQSMFGAPPPPAQNSEGKRVQSYVPTYYPGVADAAGASPIELGPGQQLTGITVPLQKGWVYRISGRLATRPAAGRMTRVMIMPRQRNPTTFSSAASGMVKPDGAFEIHHVQPGSYYVVAMQNDMTGGRPQPLARAPVDLADQDVEGVVLQPATPVEITGTVRVEADQPVSTAGMRIMLTPTEGVPFNASNAAVDEAGNFQLSSVVPDQYYLAFYGTPPSYYVRSARFGNEDALKSGLQVTGGGKLEIVLALGAATVQGVAQQEEKPYAGAFVLLAAEPFGPQTAHLRKFASSDQNGRFEFKGVAPGDYRVFAWQEPQMPLPADAEALKPVEAHAVKITIREGATEQANVTVIPPPTH
jgi:hypothetical protein